MKIIGLQTREVEGPNGGIFKLRMALSVAECEAARSQRESADLRAQRRKAEALGFDSVAEMFATVAADQAASEAVEKAQKALPKAGPRDSYDLDFAAAALIRGWPYENGDGKPAKISVEHVQMLDRETRTWLHDETWSAMRHHIPEDELEGN